METQFIVKLCLSQRNVYVSSVFGLLKERGAYILYKVYLR
jgi:hypothetical protein